MDEASRLITELQLRLAQLDHEVSIYQQDMAAEFEKYTDELLRDVPDEVSSTVNKAVAESMERYPLLVRGKKDTGKGTSAMNIDTSTNCGTEDAPTTAEAAPKPSLVVQVSETSDTTRNMHEREHEFEGLFTPSYLPLLDSTDRNERRSGSATSSAEAEALSVVARQKATDEAGIISTSDPTSTTPTRRSPILRRRSADESSPPSDHSDAPTRRSALRRKSSEAKPQSPRRVRFEFAGEEFPTTSSPKLDPDHGASNPVVPIILGNGDDPAYDGGSDQLDDLEESPSPPRRRISSSEALRLLSRRPLEDHETEWTEVISPPDGSASVPILDMADEDSDSDEVLSMQSVSVTMAAARSGRFGGRLSSPRIVPKTNASDYSLASGSEATQEKLSKENERTSAEVAEEQDTLSELAPSQPMGSHRPMTIPAAVDFDKKLTDKTQTVATETARTWSLLPPAGMEASSGADVDGQEKENYDEVEDEMFSFDEAVEGTNSPNVLDPGYDSYSSLVSDTAQDHPTCVSPHSTSTAQGINQASSKAIFNSTSENDTTNPRATPSSQRNSVHPFNIPVVSPTMHAQAASLGNITSFVGSIKDGLDEDALQSFKAGSLRAGAAPRSLSEKMAFDDAMDEARRRR